MRRRCRSREAWVARRAGTSSTATSRRERDETRRSRCAADGAPIRALVDGTRPLGRRSAVESSVRRSCLVSQEARQALPTSRQRRRSALRFRSDTEEISHAAPRHHDPGPGGAQSRYAASKMREIDSGVMPAGEHDRTGRRAHRPLAAVREIAALRDERASAVPRRAQRPLSSPPSGDGAPGPGAAQEPSGSAVP